MKKKWFIVLYIVLGLVTAFGQDAVGTSTDSEVVTEQGAPAGSVKTDEIAAESPQENAAALPESEVSAAVSAADDGSTALPAAAENVSAEPAAHTDTGVAESPASPAPNANAKNESSGTGTGIAPEQNNKAQEQKDVSQSVEMNEPAQRTKKARPFSLHTGFVVSATAANNMVSVLDFFRPELVIDLNQLSKDTMKSGIHVGAILDVDTFFRFTVLEKHTVKFSITANGDVWGNLPKSLLDLAANGNPAIATGQTINGTLNAKINVFADAGLMYQFNNPTYGFSARVAYFAPVAYMENPSGTYSLSPHMTGGVVDGITLKAQGTANIYGYLPDYLANRNFSILEVLKNGGVDLSLTGVFRPTGWVAITGGIDYLPIMPIVTTKGMQATFNYDGSVTNLLDGITSGGTSFFNQTTTTSFSSTLAEKKIMRPCKVSIGADFKPFQNDYLILSPFLAFPILNAKPYYVDGGLKIESRFAKVLGVYLDSRYVERMWKHEFCLFIDSRWFTFSLAASVASQDFKRAFTTLSGLGIKLGIGLGF